MAAEATYGIRFETSEVTTIRTLGCMRGCCSKKASRRDRFRRRSCDGPAQAGSLARTAGAGAAIRAWPEQGSTTGDSMVADLCAAGRSAEDVSQGKASASAGRRDQRGEAAIGARAARERPAGDRLARLPRRAAPRRPCGDPERRAALAPADRARRPAIVTRGQPTRRRRRPIQALAGMIAAEAGAGSALARYAEERLAVIMLATGLGDGHRARRADRRASCSGGADALDPAGDRRRPVPRRRGARPPDRARRGRPRSRPLGRRPDRGRRPPRPQRRAAAVMDVDLSLVSNRPGARTRHTGPMRAVVGARITASIARHASGRTDAARRRAMLSRAMRSGTGARGAAPGAWPEARA